MQFYHGGTKTYNLKWELIWDESLTSISTKS